MDAEEFLVITDLIANHSKSKKIRFPANASLEASSQMIHQATILEDYQQCTKLTNSMSWFKILKSEKHYVGLCGAKQVWYLKITGSICDVICHIKILLENQKKLILLNINIEDDEFPSHLQPWLQAGEEQKLLRDLLLGLYSFYSNAQEMDAVTADLHNTEFISVDSSKPYRRKLLLLKQKEPAIKLVWGILPSDKNSSMEHDIDIKIYDKNLSAAVIKEVTCISSVKSVMELSQVLINISQLINAP